MLERRNNSTTKTNVLRNERWVSASKRLQRWCSGFVSSKNKQLIMRPRGGWGNKENGGNSGAASLCAAPFLKKALWVLRRLDDQRSAMQPPVPERLWGRGRFRESLKLGRSIQVSLAASCCYIFVSLERHGWQYHGLYSAHLFFTHSTPETTHLPQFPKGRLHLISSSTRCVVGRTVTVSAGPTDDSPRSTRGRGNWPSRLCWRARRRWGRKPGSRNPTRGCWRGHVLSSSRLLYTPRSNRRSLCSLSRPGTRTGSCPRSRSRTGSCPWASWAVGREPCWRMSRPVMGWHTALWWRQCFSLSWT